MREFRPMPTTPRAMRHFGHAEKMQIGRILKVSHFLKPSDSSQTVSPSQKTENRHPTLATLKPSSAERPTREAP